MGEIFAWVFPKVIKTHHNQHLSSLTSYHIHILFNPYKTRGRTEESAYGEYHKKQVKTIAGNLFLVFVCVEHTRRR